MAEHKTIQKHFPAAFRSMRCLSCGHYATKGKIFRRIIKTISSEAYLGGLPYCKGGEIRAANARREKVNAKHTVATRVPLKDAEDAEDAEVARAVFKGGKRSSSGSEPQEESLGVEFSVSRPAKKVKKDFAKALGIKGKMNSIQ